MFKISTEFRKGVLFIRPKGRLDNGSHLEEIKNLIEDFGIQCVVLNLNKLNDVSLETIKNIIYYHEELERKKKLLIICDANPLRNRLFKHIIPKISSEIEAFSFV